jgi:cell division protein FtsN
VAARRGKSQARRNSGNGGLPGWAWMVLGIVLTIVVVLFAPKLLRSDGDGFFRPQPNPDARPAPASGNDEVVVEDSGDDTPAAAVEEPDYDFYTLLPGKEVPISDAELAATERVEAERLAARQRAAEQAAADAADRALPQPVLVEPAPAPAPETRDSEPTAAPVAGRATAAGAGDGRRFLLQAGAFQASGQAEELKARIALLGLSARVESARIGGNTVYRVRMGPYGTASDLADAKRKLESGGLPAMAIEVK